MNCGCGIWMWAAEMGYGYMGGKARCGCGMRLWFAENANCGCGLQMRSANVDRGCGPRVNMNVLWAFFHAYALPTYLPRSVPYLSFQALREIRDTSILGVVRYDHSIADLSITCESRGSRSREGPFVRPDRPIDDLVGRIVVEDDTKGFAYVHV